MGEEKESEGLPVVREPSEMQEFKTFMEALTPVANKGIEEFFKAQRDAHEKEVQARTQVEMHRIDEELKLKVSIAEKTKTLITHRHILAGVVLAVVGVSCGFMLYAGKEITVPFSLGLSMLYAVLGTSPKKED